MTFKTSTLWRLQWLQVQKKNIYIYKWITKSKLILNLSSAIHNQTNTQFNCCQGTQGQMHLDCPGTCYHLVHTAYANIAWQVPKLLHQILQGGGFWILDGAKNRSFRDPVFLGGGKSNSNMNIVYTHHNRKMMKNVNRIIKDVEHCATMCHTFLFSCALCSILPSYATNSYQSLLTWFGSPQRAISTVAVAHSLPWSTLRSWVRSRSKSWKKLGKLNGV